STAAIVAERTGDRGDDADFAAAVPIAPALRNLARVIGVDGLQRQFAVDHANDFGGGHDVIHAPAIGMADVHVFDEAQDVPRAFEVTSHGQDFMLVHPTLDHHVDLD